MKNSKLTWVVTILLTIVVQACARPQYSTFYNYDPPKTSEGKACVFQCENTKMQCEQLDQMRVSNCQSSAENDFQNCDYQAQAQYDKCVASSGAQNCFKDICVKQQNCYAGTQCNEQYQRCYSTCGGQVTSQTRCVANCEAR